MAPRGRSRKPHRMDAAFDALGQMGFQKEVIRKTVNNLLKVYGYDGWSFLEEASYKLVIDTILEGQNVQGENGDDTKAFEGSGSGHTNSPHAAIGGLDSGVGANVLISRDGEANEDEDDLPVNTESGRCMLPSPNPAEASREVPKQKRRPYHGWISESEDDEYTEEELINPGSGFWLDLEKD